MKKYARIVSFIEKEVLKGETVNFFDILSKNRSPQVVNVRAKVIIFLREEKNMSYPEIGDILNRDHTSIIHLYKTHKNKRRGF